MRTVYLGLRLTPMQALSNVQKRQVTSRSISVVSKTSLDHGYSTDSIRRLLDQLGRRTNSRIDTDTESAYCGLLNRFFGTVRYLDRHSLLATPLLDDVPASIGQSPLSTR